MNKEPYIRPSIRVSGNVVEEILSVVWGSLSDEDKVNVLKENEVEYQE